MPQKVKVYEIEQVRTTIIKTFPPKLRIEVDATVPTPGYTEPELVEYVYKRPPPDGIYDFDFVAKPPAKGPHADVITPISVSHIMEPLPKELKGVRIHASNNSVVKLLSESSQPSTICVRGKLTDEGVECQALRGDDGQLYTLLGDLNGFKNGDEVIVCGNVAEISFCMQGTTILVTWIGDKAPRAVEGQARERSHRPDVTPGKEVTIANQKGVITMSDAQDTLKAQSPLDRAPSEGEAIKKTAGVRLQPEASEFFTDHTPPTMAILDGSLIFEMSTEFDMPANSGVRARPTRLTTSYIIREMRVTDSSANTLFMTHAAEGCQISIWLQDPATSPDEHVYIQNVGNTLLVDIDQNLGPHQDGYHRQRRHIYRHVGFGGDAPQFAFNIKKVVIRKGDDILYTGLQELNDTGTQPKGIHILLWDRT